MFFRFALLLFSSSVYAAAEPVNPLMWLWDSWTKPEGAIMAPNTIAGGLGNFEPKASDDSKQQLIPAPSLWVLQLQDHEHRVFSQNGEDGILAFIFQNIGVTNRYYVEFGVETGVQRNTRLLQEENGWTGLLMDGGKSDPSINLHSHFIYAHNVHSLFRQHEVPKHFDLLSIDIDSYDLWIWRALCSGPQAFRPRVLVVEFNCNFGIYEYWTRADSTIYQHSRSKNFGASLSALYLAGRQMNYTLIYTDKFQINAFFLRDDVAPFRPTLPQIHRMSMPLGRPSGGRMTYKHMIDYFKYSRRNRLPTYGLDYVVVDGAHLHAKRGSRTSYAMTRTSANRTEGRDCCIHGLQEMKEVFLSR